MWVGGGVFDASMKGEISILRVMLGVQGLGLVNSYQYYALSGLSGVTSA